MACDSSSREAQHQRIREYASEVISPDRECAPSLRLIREDEAQLEAMKFRLTYPYALDELVDDAKTFHSDSRKAA